MAQTIKKRIKRYKKVVRKKINSRAKGKAGELEFAAFLKERGITARRGQQFKGGTDSPDVVAGECVAGIHFEVKRTQAGNPYNWHHQACTDADICKIPVVAHRKNNKPWLAIMDMRDFINIMEELYAKV